MDALTAALVVLAAGSGVLAVAWAIASGLAVLSAERAMRARRTANPAVRREGVESARILTDRMVNVRQEVNRGRAEP